MKKLSLFASYLIIGLTALANGGADINEKVLRNFKERFPQAEQTRWVELKDSYVVDFVEGGVRTNIVFDKSGAFVRSTRYYFEQTLPYYLLVTIKKAYTDKKIFGVTELATPDGIEYYVKMEDAKVWMTIRIDADGDLSVVEKYKKAA